MHSWQDDRYFQRQGRFKRPCRLDCLLNLWKCLLNPWKCLLNARKCLLNASQ
ncbi:MAG: hypothetical protein NW226_04105 [Microscillaceae bacterium]|nr:hypothetical protein [Microscillaceae bacterium]